MRTAVMNEWLCARASEHFTRVQAPSLDGATGR